MRRAIVPWAKVARRVLAIDIDRNMLDVARDRLTKAGTTNCEFVEGDAYSAQNQKPSVGATPPEGLCNSVSDIRITCRRSCTPRS